MNPERAKDHSRKAFNRRAANYEVTVAGVHSGTMKQAALACLKPPVSGSLLDLGCGPGLLLETLAAQYPELRLSGLDIAPEMIRVAKARLDGKADLRLGDSEELPWSDESFDYVFCVDSFHHYPNPERVLTEIGRVLKRNGEFVLADPTAPAPFRSVLNHLIRFLRRGDVRMYDQREITALLASAGFASIEWEAVRSSGFVVLARAE